MLKNLDKEKTDQDLLPDGLEALRQELSLADVMGLIERTARWVDPKTFEYLPVWYPEHARRGLFYKANWCEPQMNRNRQTGVSIHKSEGNTHANKALTLALGLRAGERPNWSCCHIWGVDDASYQVSNAVVQDRRFFSCVANMVLLGAGSPRPRGPQGRSHRRTYRSNGRRPSSKRSIRRRMQWPTCCRSAPAP